MFITKKHMPRRTFLRGAGVTLGLPLLSSMIPAQTALAQTAANPTTRFMGNGAGSLGASGRSASGEDVQHHGVSPAGKKPDDGYRRNVDVVRRSPSGNDWIGSLGSCRISEREQASENVWLGFHRV